jgi:hypothetical protein
MGGRSGRGSRSPIGYESGYQNSYSDAEITECTHAPLHFHTADGLVHILKK